MGSIRDWYHKEVLGKEIVGGENREQGRGTDGADERCAVEGG